MKKSKAKLKRELQKANAEYHREYMKRMNTHRPDDDIKPLPINDIPPLPSFDEEKLLNTTAQDKSLLDRFTEEVSSSEPIRELVNPRNIKLKTEVTDDQRADISRLYYAYLEFERLGIAFDGLRNVLDEFVTFGVSVGRKGRGEFVDAHGREQQQQQMFNPFMYPNANPLQQMKK